MTSELVLTQTINDDEVREAVEVPTPFQEWSNDIFMFLVDHPHLTICRRTESGRQVEYKLMMRSDFDRWNRAVIAMQRGKLGYGE